MSPTGTLRILYRLAALFVFPSCTKGFGLPPLEADGERHAVVAPNQSSLPEVTGDAAVLVDPYDVGSLVDGMRGVPDRFPSTPATCGGAGRRAHASSPGRARSSKRAPSTNRVGRR
jgi:glycosyltransferase involved in cell wall biosynthesis